MKKLKTVLALSGLLLASTSWADAPAQVKQQVPGYYRLAVGEYEVTALFDGYNDLSPAYYMGSQATRFANCWLNIKLMPNACLPPSTPFW